jgi:hypothetical protein
LIFIFMNLLMKENSNSFAFFEVSKSAVLTSLDELSDFEFFCTPSDFVVTKCHDEQDTAGTVLDGWSMSDQPPQREKIRSQGLLSVICTAAECKLFEERPLTLAETTVLGIYRVKHNTTGEERLCPRDWWMRWWGFQHTPHQKFLDLETPCSRTIISVTGLRADESSPCAKACGRDRYWKACENVFSTLEKNVLFPHRRRLHGCDHQQGPDDLARW